MYTAFWDTSQCERTSRTHARKIFSPRVCDLGHTWSVMLNKKKLLKILYWPLLYYKGVLMFLGEGLYEVLVNSRELATGDVSQV